MPRVSVSSVDVAASAASASTEVSAASDSAVSVSTEVSAVSGLDALAVSGSVTAVSGSAVSVTLVSVSAVAVTLSAVAVGTLSAASALECVPHRLLSSEPHCRRSRQRPPLRRPTLDRDVP